jgi:hypothetical protein
MDTHTLSLPHSQTVQMDLDGNVQNVIFEQPSSMFEYAGVELALVVVPSADVSAPVLEPLVEAVDGLTLYVRKGHTCAWTAGGKVKDLHSEHS